MRSPAFCRYVALAGFLCAVACGSRPTQVSHSGRGAFETALTPFGDGFAMAWYDTRHGNGEIYVRLLDADGRPSGPEQRLTDSSDESFEPSIERLGDVLVVAWYDQTAKGQQTARLGAWTADGVSRWQHALQ